MDLVLRVLAGLLPEHGSDPKRVYNWQLRVGLFLTGAIAMSLAQWALTFGMVPAMVAGTVVPVHAQDLNQVSQQLTAQISKVSQQVAQESRERRERDTAALEAAITDQRSKQCKVKTDDGRQLYNLLIQKNQAEYFKLNGRTFAVPSCQDL